jgi:hypothetical protein
MEANLKRGGMQRHKYSLSERQISLLEELMEADMKNNGVCFQQSDGTYDEANKSDIGFLRSIGFATEYTSEAKMQEDTLITMKGWTITYHGIAFLFAYHTLKSQ